MSDTKPAKKPYIRRRILIPLAIVAAGMLAIFGAIGKSVLDANIEQKIHHELEEVEGLFNRLLESESRAMHAHLELIALNTDVVEAWKAKDKDLLLKRATPIFKSLAETNRISHFYFVDVNRQCFLRVHAPEREGDVISRFTMMEAEKNQQMSSGIELGPLGTFTLRTVLPWIVDGELVGYVELGEEIGHLTPHLRWISELDVVFIVDKTKVTREDWETGSKFFGRSAEWDTFDDFVIMDKTYAAIPKEVSNFLPLAYKSSHAEDEVTMNGQTYRVAAQPLRDTTGETVGRMVVVLDVTSIYRSFHNALVKAIGIGLLAAILLLVCFYGYTGKIDKELISFRSNLRELVAARSEELLAIQKEVKDLTGFIPICSYCKKIRDDKGYWNMLELYISEHTEATFDHCICESCLKKNFPDIDEMRSVTDELKSLSDDSTDSSQA